MEGSPFAPTAEVEGMIEESLGSLYDLIIQNAGEDAFAHMTDEAATTTANTNAQSVYRVFSTLTTAEVYKILRVDVKLRDVWEEVYPVLHSEITVHETTNGWLDPKEIRYSSAAINAASVAESGPLRTSANSPKRQIFFTPMPKGAHYYRVFYLPPPIDWSSNNTYVLQGFSGWEEYIIYDVAGKLLEKEKSDASYCYQRKAEIAQRINWHAQTMNHAGAGRIRDLDMTPNVAGRFP